MSSYWSTNFIKISKFSFFLTESIQLKIILKQQKPSPTFQIITELLSLIGKERGLVTSMNNFVNQRVLAPTANPCREQMA